MDDNPQMELRVALLGPDRERGALRSLLEGEGMEVVVDGPLQLPLAGSLNGADVVLVDTDVQSDRHQIQSVLQQSPIPVLLNAGGLGKGVAWHRRLVGKLQALADYHALCTTAAVVQTGQLDLPVTGIERYTKPDKHWLVALGASIGGPGAVARFLQALPADLPTTFLLAQHIGEKFEYLLAKQLDRCSSWPVAVPGDCEVILPGQVWLVPSGRRIDIDDDGVLRRKPQAWQSTQRPDIDAVVRTAARVFRERCGVILFSGLGKDGTQGCEYVLQHDGFVWVQSSETCAMSSMPDAARECCEVGFTGSPEQLAEALAARCTPATTRLY